VTAAHCVDTAHTNNLDIIPASDLVAVDAGSVRVAISGSVLRAGVA
jgi:hypothetical protein